MSLPAIGAVLLALAALQGLAMAIFPQRFAALQLWKYRLIGARPAEPGRGTFLFYRVLGATAFIAISVILISQFLPE
jgi:hypothetical protein